MPDLEHSIRIAAAPDAVRPLVSTAEGLARWWAEDVVSIEGDGLVALAFFDRATVYRLRRESSSGGLTRWLCESGAEWEGTSLEFRCRDSDGATELEFAHRGWALATPYFVSCNTTWGALLFRLRAATEGQEPGPLFERSSLGY